MRRLLPLLSVGICAAAAQGQPVEAPQNFIAPLAQAPVRLVRRPRPVEPTAQIKQDIQEFVEALNGRADFTPMQRWVYGARIGYFGGQEWWKQVMDNAAVKIQVDDIAIGPINGRDVTVTLAYHFAVDPKLDAETKAMLEKRVSEPLPIRLGVDPMNEQDPVWQIVPPESERAAQDKMQTRSFLTFASYYLAQKTPLAVGPTSGKAAVTMSNLKQLSLGAIQFLQDWNMRYAFAPEFVHDALFPYIKSETIFLIPGSQDPYTFNENLSDTSLAADKEPAKVVLFYEGDNDTPVFRYAGKAAIAFADGHVKMVTPDEAKELVWKP